MKTNGNFQTNYKTDFKKINKKNVKISNISLNV